GSHPSCKTAFDLSAHWQTFTGVYGRTTSLKFATGERWKRGGRQAS
ncbi:hypothetical protein QPH17_004681, partial [Salmonella enterica]|nr:hypothetical protein [Salmonella enterica]